MEPTKPGKDHDAKKDISLVEQFAKRAKNLLSEGALGGPDDDHYAKLDVQPIVAIEAWAKHWPSQISPHLGEAVWSLARLGTKVQLSRDLDKTIWLLTRARDVLAASNESGPVRPDPVRD